MEHFVIIVNGWKPLTITTKHSILDAAAALDPPLGILLNSAAFSFLKCHLVPIIRLVLKNHITHYIKSVRIRSYSGSTFPAFGLNKGRYSVSLRIRSECGEIRSGRALNTDTFHAVSFLILTHLSCFIWVQSLIICLVFEFQPAKTYYLQKTRS